jgi:hypothetical protein
MLDLHARALCLFLRVELCFRDLPMTWVSWDLLMPILAHTCCIWPQWRVDTHQSTGARDGDGVQSNSTHILCPWLHWLHALWSHIPQYLDYYVVYPKSSPTLTCTPSCLHKAIPHPFVSSGGDANVHRRGTEPRAPLSHKHPWTCTHHATIHPPLHKIDDENALVRSAPFRSFSPSEPFGERWPVALDMYNWDLPMTRVNLTAPPMFFCESDPEEPWSCPISFCVLLVSWEKNLQRPHTGLRNPSPRSFECKVHILALLSILLYLKHKKTFVRTRQNQLKSKLHIYLKQVHKFNHYLTN